MQENKAVVPVSNLTDVLKDRMRVVLVEALPQEMIDGLAKKAVEEFVTGYDKPTTYGRPDRVPPELPDVVRKIVHEELRKKVADALNAKLETIRTKLGENKVDEAVDLIIGELGGAAMKGFVNAMIAPVASQMMSIVANNPQLRNGY